MGTSRSAFVRRLVLILGDQLSHDSAAWEGFDLSTDAVWMAETEEEAAYVPSHKLRLAMFFSAMRHFRDELRERGITVYYHELSRDRRKDRGRDFAEILRKDVRRLRPRKLVLVEPGDYRVLQSLTGASKELNVELDVRPDTHFYCSRQEFAEWASERKELLLETFYRMMRKRHRVLMSSDGRPEGGQWNFDKENRRSFGRQGPERIKPPRRFQADEVTREVIALVEHRFPDHPGSCEHFDVPVTSAQARDALRDFIAHRLPAFGTYQDAMWTGEDFLAHSRLSAAMNLKLLDPRDAVQGAVDAWDAGHAPLNSVEGFVRQILGWREFIRGVYWLHMPGYAQLNRLGHDRELPPMFWTGETRMRCLQASMGNVLRHGYAHHIQRLMVLGQFALLYGVHPYRFHAWHMAMYLDAVDWVSLPNTLGMSQHGDGGIVGTKPYCASGQYIHRMSNYCRGCPYDPGRATGDGACPFTTFYWDFLQRHRERFADHPRMKFQMLNLKRKSVSEVKEIQDGARELRRRIAEGEAL